MSNKKAAIFILLGQSNAVGHGLPMKEEDIIRKPLKNVFGLSRENNQSFHNQTLVWSEYTSFAMNLAEEQDNTYSIANCLAADWQKHIDAGNKNDLPDLYIVQIAIGAEGVTESFMWYPDREEQLLPGKLGMVNISLFPFSKHIFSLIEKSFRDMGKEYEIIGLHWRGGESDTELKTEYLKNNLYEIYRKIIDTYNQLLNCPPIVLHKIVCSDCLKQHDSTGEQLNNLEYVNSLFDSYTQKYDNVKTFDPRDLPQYIPDVIGNGLFESDLIHFTVDVNKEISKYILSDFAVKKSIKSSVT